MEPRSPTTVSARARSWSWSSGRSMTENALASKLSSSFTVYQYDRRGRGDSGEVGRYSVQREVEDLAALIKAAGGSAFLFGHSSGGALPSRPRPPASRFVASSSMSRLTPRDPP